MSDREGHAHWEGIHQTKGEREVSWFQETPRLSLEFIQSAGVRLDAPRSHSQQSLFQGRPSLSGVTKGQRVVRR